MNENFAKEFITKLNGKLGDDVLKVVMDELCVFTENYDIDKKCTDIVVCDDYIPQCYKVYMVTKKIEGLSKGTLDLYHFHLKTFFNWTQKPIEQITTNDIRLHLHNLQEHTKMGNKTIDQVRVIINGFLEWCYKEGYVKNNSYSAIKPIRYEQKERTPLSNVEFELFRYACNTIREKAIVEFFYSTGCRVTEMVNLNRDDVNFVTGEVRLYGKGKKYRTSYLNAKAEVMLKKYLDSRTDDNVALFIREISPHSRLTKAGIEYIIREIGKRSDLTRNVYPHLLRHTTASDALNRVMDITELKDMLGHVKLSTTMIYAKNSKENIKHSHKKYVI